MNVSLSPDEFPYSDLAGPRFRETGDLVLDRFHRDGRVDDRWLGLSKREFALLWRLAGQPGERLTGQQLRAEAWPIASAAEARSIATHIARVRRKLAAGGVAHLICTDGDGRYFLEAVPPASFSHRGAG